MTNIRPTIAFVGLLAATAVVLAVRPPTIPVEPPANLALFHQSEFISLPEGTLVRAEGDERVFYIEYGQKRWIASAGTLQAQGLAARQITTIPAAEMARYPDGEPITVVTKLILPGERTTLPDLAPLAPYELRLASLAGRKVLRFTGSFWNRGWQAFDLQTSQTLRPEGQDSTEDVYQNLTAVDGTQRTKFVGTFVFHPAHNHHHYADFADYILEPVRLSTTGAKFVAPSARQKTTFCFRDDERMAADIPNVPTSGVFLSCGKVRQGLSAGWADVYRSTLPDQYVDVSDMPAGVYALSFLLDPKRRFMESRDDNNISTTFIELDVARGVARVIAAMAPFPTLRNRAEDGTLVTTRNDGNVYVLQGGKKRWLRSVDIFNSYHYAWDSIYPVTAAMVEAIPLQNLIRARGTAGVYVINEQGYRRHVLTPEVFASYGFTAADVVDVTPEEFESYREGNLIMRPGDEQVYMVSGATKSPLGTLSMLQGSSYDLRALHVVNDADFAAYTTVVR